MLTAIILTGVVTSIVVTMSLMKVSGNCSRQEEQWERQGKRVRGMDEYCDNMCKDCGEKDECMFSEVKRNDEK